YQDGSFGNGKDYGYGIVVYDNCSDVKIIGNEINNVYTAIGTNLNRDKKLNLRIENNMINKVKVISKLSPYNSSFDIIKKNTVQKN
ncbi:MAG: hypothetical protein ACN6PI_03885, partial [Sphingobacterium siyangense]